MAILDLKGKSLIQRTYRDDVPPSTVEKFMPLLLDAEEESQTVTPCFSHEGINYLYIRHNNLYRASVPTSARLTHAVLALSKNNSNAAEILVFLHKLVSVRL